MDGSAEQIRSSVTAAVVLVAFAAIALSLTQGCAANVAPTPTAEAAVQTSNLDVEHPLNTWVHDDDLPAPGQRSGSPVYEASVGDRLLTSPSETSMP